MLAGDIEYCIVSSLCISATGINVTAVYSALDPSSSSVGPDTTILGEFAVMNSPRP